MNDEDHNDTDRNGAHWERVARAAFPRRSQELVNWASSQAGSNWLAELARRRIEGQRDAPLGPGEVINEAFMDLLDRLRIGVLVMDVEFHVYFHNRRLREMIADEPALQLQENQLNVRRAAFANRLRNSIAACTGDDHDAETASHALRFDARPPLLLYLAPAFTGGAADNAPGPLVCIYAARAVQRAPVAAQDLVHWYSLTSAEAELATAFACGDSLGEYAAQRGVSLNTVRNQFAALKSKLGAASQADVVRRVLLGNPLSAFSTPADP